MFRGDKINTTEGRAVLHTALRAPRDAVIEVDGENVVPGVHAVLDQMAAFSGQGCARASGPVTPASASERRQHRHRRLRPRSPAMAYECCVPSPHRDLTVRFVSNVDGADLHEAVRDLDPAETLFVIASKTFTTIETITNATSARSTGSSPG